MRSLYYFCLFLLMIFCAGPLLFLAGKPTSETYSLALHNVNTLRAMQNTLLVAGGVGVTCVLWGLPLAWILTRTDLPGRGRFRSLYCLPYMIPPYVGAIGWIILANPSSGVLNQWLGLSMDLYSVIGLIFVESSFLFTFVLLGTMASLDQMDSSLEEAARLSGASPLRVFWQINLPLLRPALAHGFLLCFLATAASFGVPALIGAPARIYLMTTQIYTFQRMGTTNGLELAFALSALLMAVSLILLLVANGLLIRSKFAVVSGKTARPSLVSLGPWRWPLFGGLLAWWTVIFVLPLAGISLSAFSRTQGILTLDNFGFDNFRRVLFQTEETGRAILHSLGLGAVAALVCAGFALLFGFLQNRRSWRSQTLGQIILALPFSTPGTVVALALILSFSHGLWGLGPPLYNTLLLIAIAYIIKYVSLAHKTVGDGFHQIHPSLEEAARVSGANSWAVLRTIYTPLLKSPLIAAAFLVFMPAFSELTMSVLLTGPGLETIGTLIFSLQEYSDVGGGGAAVLSLLVVGIILTLNFALKFISKGKYGI